MIKKDFIKILFSLLIYCLVIISCKFSDVKSNYYKLDEFESVYISVLFSDKIKINSKYLLMISDTTDDVTNDVDKDRYIFDKEEIEKYKSHESLLFSYIFEKFEDYPEISKIKKLENDSDDLTDFLIISIMVEEYNVGEYNLIKNKPTIIKFIVKILKKDMQTKDILLLNRKYRAKADIGCATEDLRIKNVSDQISNDLLKILGLNN